MAKTLYCSFCGKAQHEVRHLIGGPALLFICDECVDLCSGIIAGTIAKRKAQAATIEISNTTTSRVYPDG